MTMLDSIRVAGEPVLIGVVDGCPSPFTTRFGTSMVERLLSRNAVLTKLACDPMP